MSNTLQDIIKEAREHAERLRVAMQDQAAETIESLCDAFESATRLIAKPEAPEEQTPAEPRYRVFCEAITPRGVVTGFLQAVSDEIQALESSKALATATAVKASSQALAHLCLVGPRKAAPPKLIVLPKEILEQSVLTFWALPASEEPLNEKALASTPSQTKGAQ